ncbi:MAG: FIST C-terminal domain-containing protein, partial [Succiniclasticum sp.]|nr:FIST C-terminal domain-containing protein [Succiniclasticum sp.]
EPAFAERLIEIYKKRGIKGSLCGYTAANALEYGICTSGGSNISFLIFDRGHADVKVYEAAGGQEAAAGEDTNARLKAVKDARALQLIPDIMHLQRLDDFLGRIHVPMEFPVAGSSAGGIWGLDGFAPMFVFSDHVFTAGILTIIYSGEDLSAKARALTGWVPVGRMHSFTKTVSPTVVSEIDDLPASYIYKKYFNIEPNEAFYDNTLGFPIYVRRNGEEIPRCVQAMDEEKNLIFASDIKVGETFYFSFGNISRMLQDASAYADELAPFSPQASILMICDYRFSYMGVDEQKEVDYFSRVSPGLSGGGAFGEFFNFNGRIENLNCSCIVLSLREGPAAAPAAAKEPAAAGSGTIEPIPLVDRLYSFLSETSNEYAALRSKERERNMRNAMEVERAASEAKSQFLMNVSHEIRTPINAILGMDEMILRESGDEKILDYAEDIKAAGGGLLSLVN